MKKKCVTCKDPKPLNDFYKKSAALDGLQSSCKNCSKLKLRKFRKDNPGYFEYYYKQKIGYYENRTT